MFSSTALTDVPCGSGTSKGKVRKRRAPGGMTKKAMKKARAEVSALCEARFVSIVRGYEELYDPDHPAFDDARRKKQIWQEIAAILNETAQDSKKRWVRLRDNYRNNYKRWIERCDAERGQPLPTLKNGSLMSFLNPFLVKEDEPIVEESNADNSPAEATDSSDDGSDNSSCCDESFPRSDPTVDFFVKIGESITDLPEDVRIRVKREAFRIVTDAEEMLYHNKLKLDLQEYVNKQ